jgi:hypothetical protein
MPPLNWDCLAGEAERVYLFCVRVDVGVYACGLWYYARRLDGPLLWWDDWGIYRRPWESML